MRRSIRPALRALALIGVILGALSAWAPTAAAQNAPETYASPPRLVDGADLLSEREEDLLRRILDSLVEEYACDIVLVSVESTEGQTARADADDFYDYGGYGIGPDDDGLLFLIVMDSRDLWISTHGLAIRLINDYEIDRILDRAAPYFTDGDYDGGFRRFLADMEDGLREYSAGDYGGERKLPREKTLLYLAGAGGAALLLALAVTLAMRRGMNTARPNNLAQEYVKPGSFNLRESKEIYLYQTVIKTPRASAHSSGGGSRTHRSSSGRIHGGGGRRF
ncbi:MAG: TPM domain-containing protein [Gracilibacteraceae bacterium]|jgi:uncharacterized protein|nr:TPM domain-containing protein [Gracilibacteraceae bacterium]